MSAAEVVSEGKEKYAVLKKIGDAFIGRNESDHVLQMFNPLAWAYLAVFASQEERTYTEYGRQQVRSKSGFGILATAESFAYVVLVALGMSIHNTTQENHKIANLSAATPWKAGDSQGFVVPGGKILWNDSTQLVAFKDWVQKGDGVGGEVDIKCRAIYSANATSVAPGVYANLEPGIPMTQQLDRQSETCRL